ncbi:udp-glucuronosyl udp-glucosyltransferase [Podospora australis]|uniref:Udp-glucuronosyl udp-glucosyltransferase n=1 Tax=Podospora australis TaxID=1536484 RepID=A0AAN6WIR1_9PEZI|nr:udp-glucuronosyl udp-glucosyltransferase [Podospora australis]
MPQDTNETKAKGGRENPFVLMCCTPIDGHMFPLLQIAEDLVGRGWEVHCMSTQAHREWVERAGAKFVPDIGIFQLTGHDLSAKSAEHFVTDPALEQMQNLFGENLKDYMPAITESLRSALSHLRGLDADREVVIVNETFHFGALALKLGAKLPEGYDRLPKTLGISILPLFWTSIDAGPTSLTRPFDSSPEGREAHKEAAAEWYNTWKSVHDRRAEVLRANCGAPLPLDSLFGDHANLIAHDYLDPGVVCHDTTLQMCIPALELPFTDLPPHIKFGGTLPTRPGPKDLEYPAWWKDVFTARDQNKKVIMIAQGTLQLDATILIVTALRALATRSDLLVVALLGKRGATLPLRSDGSEEPVPPNARVLDYFPYDMVLRHADVFLAIAGYGALQHAVANGVPMVLGGDTEDKPQVALRGEQAGFAVNLRMGRPTEEAISEGLDRVLREPAYKKRAMELKKQAEDFQPFDVIERELKALSE